MLVLSGYGDPLTMHIKGDRQGAEAILIPGHTGVLSWHARLSNHQHTQSLIGSIRQLTLIIQNKLTYSDK